MKIDCQNLECPEPLIRVKNAIEAAKIGDEFEILVNSAAPLKNICKFLDAIGFKFSTDQDSDYTIIKTAKTKEPKIDINPLDFSCEIRKKAIFIASDKIGDDGLGQILMSKFLSSLSQTSKKPDAIICVNSGVKITTSKAFGAFETLKSLENNGTKILSCGTCLEALGLIDKLCVGEISNAYEIMNLLLEYDVVRL